MSRGFRLRAPPIALLSGLCAGLLACSAPPPAAADARVGSKVLVDAAPGQPSLLVFSRTAGFRHASIPTGVQALSALAQAHGFGLVSTEDDRQFTDQILEPFAAVVFLSTTGDVLNDDEQAAFERYIRAGHGYVGIHAAADCEYDWPFYGGLVGAYFGGHSLVVQASIELEPVAHPALSGLPSPWVRTDEWYGFRQNPRPLVTVLLDADESSYGPAPGQGQMGADHPLAWFHTYEGGRAFYTALGHTSESFSEPAFLSHLLGGIQWAAGLVQ